MDGTFYINLPSYPASVQKPVLEGLFEGWVLANCAWLQAHTRAPGLYASGVIYRREEPEVWKDIPSILEDGCDDCEGLSCYLAAELRVRHGVRSAAVRLIEQPTRTRRRLWHAVVSDAAGKIWDPSRRLGMGSPTDIAPTKRGRVKCK